MRSWVFRHRLRLRAVYGPLPVPETSASGRRVRAKPASSDLRPGEWQRKGAIVTLRPMSPPAA